MTIHRHGHDLLLRRIWQLRHQATASDASYLALAEGLDVPILTCDRKLAGMSNRSARIEVV